MTPTEFAATGFPWPERTPQLRAPFIECIAFHHDSGERVVKFPPPARPERTYTVTTYNEYDGEPLDSHSITRSDDELAAALVAWEKVKDGVGVVRAKETVTASFKTEFGSVAEGDFLNGAWHWATITD